jgi:SagB-type dehydrogenase family enzyme
MQNLKSYSAFFSSILYDLSSNRPEKTKKRTMNQQLESAREFLKDNIRQMVDFSQTDQRRRIPPPPIEKPFPPDTRRIRLPGIDQLGGIGTIDLKSAIARRESCRNYLDQPLTLDEISFLLWATQGLRLKLDAGHALRTVPSAGCRHAFETYLCVLKVEGIEQGIYRYLPLEHELLFVSGNENLENRMVRATLGQSFTGDAAAVFVWTTIPYRMEWRYGLAAHKVIALDAGHVCQNLYLACEAIGAGTCAIAAYNQKEMDNLLGIDGEEEFTIYLAPVGLKL